LTRRFELSFVFDTVKYTDTGLFLQLTQQGRSRTQIRPRNCRTPISRFSSPRCPRPSGTGSLRLTQWPLDGINMLSMGPFYASLECCGWDNLRFGCESAKKDFFRCVLRSSRNALPCEVVVVQKTRPLEEESVIYPRLWVGLSSWGRNLNQRDSSIPSSSKPSTPARVTFYSLPSQGHATPPARATWSTSRIRFRASSEMSEIRATGKLLSFSTHQYTRCRRNHS